jgi:hypothetical protein
VNPSVGPESVHQLARVAAGLRRAAHGLGVDLPVTYAQALATQGLRVGDPVGVTRLGCGVVLHTLPEADDRLPVVLGYADANGQWYRDGSRHQAATEISEPATPIRRGIER